MNESIELKNAREELERYQKLTEEAMEKWGNLEKIQCGEASENARDEFEKMHGKREKSSEKYDKIRAEFLANSGRTQA